jgi:hypothetical protein
MSSSYKNENEIHTTITLLETIYVEVQKEERQHRQNQQITLPLVHKNHTALHACSNDKPLLSMRGRNNLFRRDCIPENRTHGAIRSVHYG